MIEKFQKFHCRKVELDYNGCNHFVLFFILFVGTKYGSNITQNGYSYQVFFKINRNQTNTNFNIEKSNFIEDKYLVFSKIDEKIIKIDCFVQLNPYTQASFQNFIYVCSCFLNPIQYLKSNM